MVRFALLVVFQDVRLTSATGLLNRYYYGPKYEGNMPKHPNWKSFVRASTLSLGSIAFGSLIVTILEIIRMLMNIVQQNAAQDGNAIGAILACVASCCIGCIESLVAWFNRYAYIEISLYGKAYVSSLSSGSFGSRSEPRR